MQPLYTSLPDLIRSQAEENPSAPAILAPGRLPLTYGRLNQHVEEVLGMLNSLGIARNDRVATVLPEGPELAVTVVTIASGATCVPLNPAYRAAELHLRLANLNCKALLVPEKNAAVPVSVGKTLGIPILEMTPLADAEAGLFTLNVNAAEFRRARMNSGLAQPTDIALGLSTSGTTGRPKLAPLTHKNICTSAYAIRNAVELRPSDRCLNVMPLFHIHGLSTIFASLAAGASVICPAGFSPEQFFAWLNELHPTWYTAAPTIHQAILKNASHFPEIVARSGLRFIRSASAAMPPQVIADLEHVFQVPFIEAYGMTEAAPQVSSNRLPPARRKLGSVGPAAGPAIAIIDEAGNSMPSGQVGEIAIRGDNVMEAYENDPEANESAFIRGWFRTGDLGYLDTDGYLFVTGRLKEIINRGGEKISPREVDEVLLKHPAVAHAVTFAMPHASLGEAVAAVIVPRANISVTEAEIREFANTHLAHFKVPQKVVFVNEIPGGSSDKLARAGLAQKLGLIGQEEGRAPFIAPRTPAEEKLAAIWAGVLKIHPPSIHDDFFQCGGDSLTATQFVARLRDEFRVDLSIESFFSKPTVAGLAELVSQARSLTQGPSTWEPRRRGGGAGPFPLTFAQERLWFLDQMEANNAAYNVCAPVWLTGNLNLSALDQSLNEIRRRHEVLRTAFRLVGEKPSQFISQFCPSKLPVVDLTTLPPVDREPQALRLAAEDAKRPFDLARGELFRATLVRLNAEEHVLLLTAHHIVSDGWSTGVLHRELRTLYEASLAGQQSPLPELPMQFADFAAWQREWLQGEVLEGQLAYWKDRLRDVPPVINLPTDRLRPAVQSFAGSSKRFVIPDPLRERLKALSQREDATLFMILLAAFQTLLFRYAGQDDFVVGVPIANRTRLETEALIGFFANTLALRADLSGNPSFCELLRRVCVTAKGAYGHQDVPFEKLVEELEIDRDPSRMPLVQVMFAFQNLPEMEQGAPVHRLGSLMTGHRFELGGGLGAHPFKVDSSTAKFDLTLYLWETGQGLAGSWQYNTELFEASTMERIAAQFQLLLEGIVANPELRLSEFPLLTEAERKHLEMEWNRRAAPPSRERCFHHIFEAQAEKAPDAVAVEYEEEHLTYSELNGKANQLARHLQKLGVHPETLVGISLTRSTQMLIAVLGVLKAGGAYVPLDPEYPAERLAFMLADTRLKILVTENRLLPALKPEPGIERICIDTDWKMIAREQQQNPESAVTAANLAYVIYTSGSMGRPKGVMITHANVVHYVQGMREAVEVAGSDRYLHTASFAFSSSVRQFAVPLSCGATVVVAPTDQIRDPRTLFDLVRRRRVSIMDIVPSYWRTCIEELKCLEPAARSALLNNDLRLILSASERLSADLPKEWASVFLHGARMINMYGQTETTGIVLTHSILDPNGVVPIGRPIANTQVYVLDASGRQVPIGGSGELFIGGAGVGRGYLNQPDLTAQRFVPDHLGASTEAKLYRTGDIVRYRSDGSLEFIGRADNQIKIRGFRIDPEEIEVVLGQHPWVRQVAVVKDAGPVADGDQRLVAFVVPRKSIQPERLAMEMRDFLKRKLPEYMVPSAIVKLDALPLTANGKLDRKALSTLKISGAGLGADNGTPSKLFRSPAAPRTDVEKTLMKIWQEVLHLDSLGVEDNFFDLGGDSLRTVQVIRRANEAGLQVSVKQIFLHQTIAELARVASFRDTASVVQENVVDSAPNVCSGKEARDPELADVEAAAIGTGQAVRVSVESARAYGREVLERAGLSPEGAAIVTEVQLEASLRGQPTHNLDSIPRYARRIIAGKMNPFPRIRIERETSISAQIDGDNGPGQWVGIVAIETAIRKAKEKGIAVVAVRRSNHFGAAGHYVWLAAQQGLIGLCTTNGPSILAPTGGLTPTFGNNPIGVGIPAGRYHPILLDIAMSVAPRGKIGLQLAEGRPLPLGWIFDRFGRPSTDPTDLAAGLAVPIGAHKGYGLALVFEVLAGVLSGSGFGWDHDRELMHHGSDPRDIGHFFMVIDPELFGPLGEFTARVERMIQQTKAGKRAEDVKEILIPGEAELRAREQNIRQGVPIRRSTYKSLRKYGVEGGLENELVVISD